MLGLGIAQYVLKFENAQRCNKIGSILTMCYDWVKLSNALVFEKCLAM